MSDDSDFLKAIQALEKEKREYLERQKVAEQISNLQLRQGDSKEVSPQGKTSSDNHHVVDGACADPISVTGAGDAYDPGNDSTETQSRVEVSIINKLLHSRLITTKTDLEVLQKDPNSPLHSVKSFQLLNLRPDLLKGVYAMGFNSPSKIQETALPVLLSNPPQNMIAQSQSGTGKTAAFVLTMLSRVDTSLNFPQCLCLAPTYELALQIGDVTKKMSKFIPALRIAFGVRGQNNERGKIDAHIVIGTPGTVLDWTIKYRRFDLKNIRVFVLDEADVMIGLQGHQDQSIRIQRGLRAECQMLLFSATYDNEVMKFAEIVVKDATVIKLRRDEESLDNIKQFYMECRTLDDKYRALDNIYGSISIGQCMIFCQRRDTASWLAAKLTADGHAVGLLSGELDVTQRAHVINRFREGKIKVLVTTNVSARGIDVEQVTVVVNFDLPVDVKTGQAECETYLHRIGRSGRFGKNGLAINMVDGPNSMRVLKDIEKHFGRKIVKLDSENFDELEKLGS